MVKRKSKYNNSIIKTPDGTFHSKGEYARWCELKLLQRANLIRGLDRQHALRLSVNGVDLGKYVADFRYDERLFDVWNEVYEDFKSPATITPEFKLKSKLVKALCGIDIKITGAKK